MRVALKLCLGASLVIVACGRQSPLESTEPVDASGHRSPTEVVAVSDAGSDASSDAPRAHGGRVPIRAIAVATGEVHSCALLEDHEVKCWGDNSFGQLGYGDMRTRGSSSADMGDALPIVDLGTGRTAVAIAASRYATCAIVDDGSVKCWGWSGLGGQPDAKGNGNLGDEPGEMGDHLAPLDLGGRNAKQIAMGETAGCASMDDDTIWCWGGGAVAPWPQFWLPAKRVTGLAPGGGGLVALYDDGSVSPSLPNGRIPVLTSNQRVVALAGGVGAGTCALFDDGTTTCTDGALSRFAGPANAIAIGVERSGGLCSAFADGSVRCHEQSCNQPGYYQCASDGAFFLGAAAVTITNNGSEFACALLADGGVKCWGGYLTMPPAAWLGAGIQFTQTDVGITYGAWNSIDLGTMVHSRDATNDVGPPETGQTDSRDGIKCAPAPCPTADTWSYDLCRCVPLGEGSID